ncbi:hypothetical protein QI060_06950 [Staphylococcus saprophyticus]|uniref:hypothetical protein n=1 Tax=Staphylococcus saprophyticus TaxID=29385 RepID=UPI0029701D9B|nr:hypothetical protein [Staphylococcus saprophyticus]MDW4302045.1 hypothetical protein [Staphylococcus saprophyticus]MDW4460286.1 hypothetical protein [Staphylococcus saprophyticus]
MNNDIFNAFVEMTSASNEVYSLKGEFYRLYELAGTLNEKIKAYKEEGNNVGANAIATVLTDDVYLEIECLKDKFQIAFDEFEQKAKRLKNVCAIYGIDIQLGKNDNIINFNKLELK